MAASLSHHFEAVRKGAASFFRLLLHLICRCACNGINLKAHLNLLNCLGSASLHDRQQPSHSAFRADDFRKSIVMYITRIIALLLFFGLGIGLLRMISK
jgi:hypothetical protein